MELMYERCAGLDVHKKSVTVCTITPEGKDIRTYDTTTRRLLEMSEWLQSKGIKHVAMESTGVYWKPIYNLLEAADFSMCVVNAHRIKTVPGRKTDVKDAEWIADLHRHGLLSPSFIPDRNQRELRELVRYRKELVHERAREVNRIQKVLEGANIKLGDVVSDISGKSGRAMLSAIVEGYSDPEILADMAKGRLKSKKEQLKQALEGLVGPHQKMLLGIQLEHLKALEQQIEQLNKEIEARMRPFDEAIKVADHIPGIGVRIAQEILAEMGTDMSRFPSHYHLASWAGLSPGNNESAGKRLSGRIKHGNPHIRTALVEAAHAAAHTKDTYYSAMYHRLAARRGAKRAIVAVAHAILVALYHMLKNGTCYEDLGPDYLEKLGRERLVRKAKKQLENLGYRVTLEAA
jgi:transposase